MDKKTLLKVWNCLWWISVSGMSITLACIGLFTLYGAKTNLYLWGSVAFYFISASNSLFMTHVINKSDAG